MISESASFHSAIFDALCAALGLSPSSSEAVSLIHEAYAEPENVPRPSRSRNVIYWSVLRDPGTDPAAPALGRSGAAGFHIPCVSSTLKYQLVIVCYGPACEEYAQRIRSLLFVDSCGRKILRAAGIYPVPDPEQPTLLWEEEGSLWRRRADLVISLRVRDEQRGPAAGSLQSVPAVILHH